MPASETRGLSDYLEAVARAVEDGLGGGLTGLYLSGSAALGDFDPHRSDIDLIAIGQDPLDEEAKNVLGRAVSHADLPCPAAGLDFVLLLESKLTQVVPSYELGIETGADWGLRIDRGGLELELLVDLAVCRQCGERVRGPAATEMIPSIPEAELREAMGRILQWHREHLFEDFYDRYGQNAVLNACRASRYVEDKRFVSKREAGQAFQSEDGRDIVQDALAVHLGRRNEPLPRVEVERFLHQILEKLSWPSPIDRGRVARRSR